MSRRVVHNPGARYERVIWVRPERPMSHAEWSKWFERRALRAGHTAVIDGVVIAPGTPEAGEAIARLALESAA